MARKEALKTSYLYIGATLGILAMVKSLYPDDVEDDDNALNVETNPTSTDFLKLRIGNLRIDLFGGFQQEAVLLARLMMQKTTPQAIKLGGNYYEQESESLRGVGARKYGTTVAGDFLESKISPPIGMLLEGWRGVNKYDNTFLGMDNIAGYDLGKQGEEYNLAGSMLSKIPPMWQKDIYDISVENGGMAAWVAGSLSFLGEGVSLQNNPIAREYEKRVKKLIGKTDEQKIEGMIKANKAELKKLVTDAQLKEYAAKNNLVDIVEIEKSRKK